MQYIQSLVARPLILVVITVLLAGCAPAVGSLDPDAKIFRTMLSKDPVSLDPMMAQDPETVAVIKAIFDGLTDYDPDTLEVVPAVAESWDSDETGTVWTFHIKEGYRYHEPSGILARQDVAAEDFKFAWERVADRDSASPLFYLMESIKGYEELRSRASEEMDGIEVVDEHTLRVTLRYPMADFPALVGHVAFSPLIERSIDLSPSQFAKEPIGNGPFIWADWLSGQELVLDSFPEYGGEHKPKLDRVVFHIYDDERRALDDFRIGALDETQIPIGEMDALKADPEYAEFVFNDPSTTVAFLGFNHAIAPYGNNVRLRRAANHSINREAVASAARAAGQMSEGIVPSVIPGNSPVPWPLAFDSAAVTRELDAAGFPGGRELPSAQLGYNRDGGHQGVADGIRATLTSSSIPVALAPDGFSSYIGKVEAGVFPMFLTGWTPDYPVPDAYIAPLYQSRSADGLVGALNTTRFRSAELDELLAEARATLDSGARMGLYQEMEAIIAVEAPVVPLYELKTRRVINPWVVGYKRTALNETPFELIDIERVEIAPDEH